MCCWYLALRGIISLSLYQGGVLPSHYPECNMCCWYLALRGIISLSLYQGGVLFLPSHYPECNMCFYRCLAGSEDVCSYLSWCPLASSLQKGDNSALVSASVCAECVRKFDSSLPMTPEQHFYPAALSFGKHSLVFS